MLVSCRRIHAQVPDMPICVWFADNLNVAGSKSAPETTENPDNIDVFVGSRFLDTGTLGVLGILWEAWGLVLWSVAGCSGR